MLDIKEIRKLYEEGHYQYKLPEKSIPKTLPLDHVFDKYLSDECNRAMVISHNELVEDLKRKQRIGQADLNRQLTYDVVKYIEENYSLTEAQAILVEQFTYEEYHSSMYDYFSHIDIIAKFAYAIINLNSKG